MRHRVYGKHLGRDKDERKSLFKGLVYSLFLHGTIQTSQTKAKAIKGLVDKIVNTAKSKRQDQLRSLVPDKRIATRLTEEILPKLSNKTSGYTSLVKMGTRPGDQTMIIKMSLIGVEKLKPFKKEVSKEGKVSKVSEAKTEPVRKEATKKVPAKRKVVKK
ncbi:hypothetical protein HYS95_02700 [Candidatus Daviesbacteria bacterium]|nr:hypothetical protein [Candidatus Daviesbacteria bacterium]